MTVRGWEGHREPSNTALQIDAGPTRTFAMVLRGSPRAFLELHRAAEDLGLRVIYEKTSYLKLYIDEQVF